MAVLTYDSLNYFLHYSHNYIYCTFVYDIYICVYYIIQLEVEKHIYASSKCIRANRAQVFEKNVSEVDFAIQHKCATSKALRCIQPTYMCVYIILYYSTCQPFYMRNIYALQLNIIEFVNIPCGIYGVQKHVWKTEYMQRMCTTKIWILSSSAQILRYTHIRIYVYII